MSKAAKRERQKANKQIKDEQAEKAQVRSKRMKGFKGLALVLFVPIVIVAALLINNATNSDVYTAQITVAIDGEKNLPNNGVIDIELDWDRAQKSSKHFIGYAKDGLYDGMEWHRVVKDLLEIIEQVIWLGQKLAMQLREQLVHNFSLLQAAKNQIMSRL